MSIKMSNIAKNRIHSGWTPLSNEEANQKIFEERRDLVGRWFDKWSDPQRKTVISDLLSRCKKKQIVYAGDIVNLKRPIHSEDFTNSLPRVLSLYVFSFLDPRSLCRCAQVGWHWRNISELDQIWMPKCLRLGWVLPFQPSPYESGVWKRLYIENIVALKCLIPKIPKHLSAGDMRHKVKIQSEQEKLRNTPRPKSGRGDNIDDGRRPWRGSDPVPQDTWRNNYFDNADEVAKVHLLRQKGGYYSKETQDIMKRAQNKVKTGLNSTYRSPQAAVQRSKSASRLNDMGSERPDWAKASVGAPFMDQNEPKPQDASIRPAPVTRTQMKMALAKRSNRDPPTTELFPQKPWNVPDDEYDSDTY